MPGAFLSPRRCHKLRGTQWGDRSERDSYARNLVDGKLAYGKRVMLADWGPEQDYRLLCNADLDAQLAKTVKPKKP